MLGYWRRPEETAPRAGSAAGTARRPRRDDAEGFVTLVGRLKELYISGGENVYPAEVERVLGQHGNVSEVAVVGVPDERWGETGRAYVVPVRSPFDSAELLAWAGSVWRATSFRAKWWSSPSCRARRRERSRSMRLVSLVAPVCVSRSSSAALFLGGCAFMMAMKGPPSDAAGARPGPRAARRDAVQRFARLGRRLARVRDVSPGRRHGLEGIPRRHARAAGPRGGLAHHDPARRLADARPICGTTRRPPCRARSIACSRIEMLGGKLEGRDREALEDTCSPSRPSTAAAPSRTARRSSP